MIRFLPEVNGSLEEACRMFPAIGTQIYGYASRYGGNFPFCTFWVIEDEKGEPLGALGRFHHTMRLSCQTLPPDTCREVQEFLQMMSWNTLEGPAEIVEQMSEKLGCSPQLLSFGQAMERPYSLPRLSLENRSIQDEIRENPPLQEVFQILRDSVPEFSVVDEMEWRRDASHLLRHNGGKYGAVPGKAAAAVAAHSPCWGLISQVATRPEFRGNGYASALTAWCVDVLAGEGRSAALLCQSSQAGRIYVRLGFKAAGRFAVLHRG